MQLNYLGLIQALQIIKSLYKRLRSFSGEFNPIVVILQDEEGLSTLIINPNRPGPYFYPAGLKAHAKRSAPPTHRPSKQFKNKLTQSNFSFRKGHSLPLSQWASIQSISSGVQLSRVE